MFAEPGSTREETHAEDLGAWVESAGARVLSEPEEAKKKQTYQHYGGVVSGQQATSRTESGCEMWGKNSQRLLKMEPTRDDWTTRSSHFTSARIYKTGLAADNRARVIRVTHGDNQLDTVFKTRRVAGVISTKSQTTLTRTLTRYPASKHEFR